MSRVFWWYFVSNIMVRSADLCVCVCGIWIGIKQSNPSGSPIELLYYIPIWIPQTQKPLNPPLNQMCGSNLFIFYLFKVIKNSLFYTFYISSLYVWYINSINKLFTFTYVLLNFLSVWQIYYFTRTNISYIPRLIWYNIINVCLL